MPTRPRSPACRVRGANRSALALVDALVRLRPPDDEIGRCEIGPYRKRSIWCAAAALLVAAGCGDSSDSGSASVTLPPLPSTTLAPVTTITTSTSTASTTRSTPATTSLPTTTAPTTTRVRASDATAQAFFEGWVANDAAKMAANGEAAAVTQATALASSRNRPWNFDRCEGAAGSVYCSWLDAGQRLIIRVRNVEPPPRAVIEVRIEAA